MFSGIRQGQKRGVVILEALVNGIPVVTTEVCGFSFHVRRAEAGMVITEPFTALKLINALREAINPFRWETCSANAAAYGADPQLYRGLDRALQEILEIN
jgi:UDP-glucose:(heptosyl)LPS alpha-1,3-glucosyltransferase